MAHRTTGDDQASEEQQDISARVVTQASVVGSSGFDLEVAGTIFVSGGFAVTGQRIIATTCDAAATASATGNASSATGPTGSAGAAGAGTRRSASRRAIASAAELCISLRMLSLQYQSRTRGLYRWLCWRRR